MTAIERTTSSTSTKLTSRSSSCSLASSTRKQNRSEFAKYYSDLCHVQHSHPLTVIKQNLDKGILDFYCDRIKFDEWWSIINALSCDKSLHLIAIRSRHPQRQAIESADTELKARAVVKQPVVTTRFVLLWLVEAIKMCLSGSSTLTVLELEGLPLTGDYLSSLSRGLRETNTVQHLSLTKCPIQDEGAEVVCNAIKNLPCVISLDLSQCGLTENGADIIARLIKYQKLNRYSEAWKQTLRYRDPDVEAMPGLRRITLNNNQGLGDNGICILAEEIKDDLWLRALDVQDCGLTDEGGRLLLDLVESNSNLCIVDGRGNPFMNEKILLEIMNQLAVNNQNKNNSEYKWINKNLDLNKKKFQAGTARPRPWTCQSSTRLASKAPPPSECVSTVTLAKPQLKRSNTTLTPGGVWGKTQKEICDKPTNGKCSENERLRLQLRDLTLILSQEVRHKLALMEENKNLKELLEKGENEKKKLEEAQNNKMLIAEDTLKVLEETITKFGMYIEQKQREEEETSESTTTRSTDENEIPELVSNLKILLRKASSSTDQTIDDKKTAYQKHKEKARHSKSETRSPGKNEKKIFIDIPRGERQEEEEEKVLDQHRILLEKMKRSRSLKNRPKNQTIWEEDETSSNCGDPPRNSRTDTGKSKAQAMFMKILEQQERGANYSTDTPDTANSQDEVSSNESDYDSKSPEIPEKILSSSYEENSS